MVEVKKLVWDEFNVEHIGRHGVTKDEVEEICISEYVTLETYKFRIMLFGKTRAGRTITVVLALKSESVYYPVTARLSSRKERQYYQQQRGGENVA